MSAIGPIVAPSLASITSTPGTTRTAPAEQDFAGSFLGALRDAKNLETAATKADAQFAANDPAMGIHEVIIASEKANIAVRYATTLKSKALEAYRELMNTQV
ncbi:MAG: flagellar hook-basal body complex protein FliE [Proteobacteria bacterium]|nr:flagellar hook-basal body complex protein FliE [Pseudomonadota bacterium]